jgi:hypothetical protein
MPCPYCKSDCSILENYDNIYQNHECPSCYNQIWLDYDEDCYEDGEGCLECYGLWNWLKEEKYE